MSEKIPPHDIDAEEATIGSLLIGGDLGELSLEPNDFYHEHLIYAYKACMSLNKRGTSINQITLAQELQKDGKLELVGGAAYLSHLISICPTHLDLPYYADIVQRLSISRRLIFSGQKIEDIGYKAEPDISKSMNQADELLLEVRKHGIPSPIISPRDRADLLMERYGKLYQEEQGVAIKTGLIDLNYHLGGGLYNGDFIIVGARPSVGKTSLLQFIANHVAKERAVLFCSAEMGVESLSDRDVAGLTGMSIGDIRRGGYTEEKYADIVRSLGEISERNVNFYHDTPLTTDKILQQGMAMKLRYGLGLVVVDYLGMLDDEYGRSSYDRVSYISRKLKQVANKLDVPLLVAHQLSRALEQRSDKRPQLFDLRESGRLEEDADIVLFLYRENYYYTQEDWEREYDKGNDNYSTFPENIVEVLIAKQRQGQSNLTVKVLFDKEHQVYRDLVRSKQWV